MTTPISYRPGFPLNQMVDAIWVARADSFEASSTHHAALFTELIFNYGDQFQVEGENTESLRGASSQWIASGLKSSPFRTTISGRHLNVGLICKPHCYRLLLDGLEGQQIHELAELLFEALIEPAHPRFKKAEQVLINFFGFEEIDSDLIRFEKYISAGSLRRGALRDFNKSTAMSQKGFIQKFKRQYFLTPGEYLRLKQVNYATSLIRSDPSASLTQIGLQSGFFDQSHFIRVFRKHHGCTPKQFQKTQIDSGVNPVQF